MYTLDAEIKADPRYQSDCSQYKVALLRLYAAQGPLEVAVVNENLSTLPG